jgi:hypothetical protein
MLVPAFEARGHAIGETYIWLDAQADHFSGRVEFRLADLREHLGLEIPEDYRAARERILELAPRLEEYVREHFELSAEGRTLEYRVVRTELLEAPYFGHFAQIFFRTESMQVPDVVTVKARFLFEHTMFQRCLLCTEYNHKTGETWDEAFFHHIFSPFNDEQEVDFRELLLVQQRWRTFVWQGILHIWIGIDHILFLVALLLSAVLVKRRLPSPADPADGTAVDASNAAISPRYEWVPVESFGSAFWNILKIVTIFTVAHSITLALASLGIVSLPSRLVESVIALSIILVALNNIIPAFRDKTWLIIFGFGLFHGLGFASVMQDLPYRIGNLNKVLIGFNVGVEIGQIVIVALVFPAIFLLRKTSLYKPVILTGGSLVLIAIATWWFIERAFAL